MHVFMVWLVWHMLLLHMLQLRQDFIWLPWLPFFDPVHRRDLRCRRRVFSVALIPSPTLSVFTTVFLTFSRTLMRCMRWMLCWAGGTGKQTTSFYWHAFSCWLIFLLSQVFPNYTANAKPVSKNSALAKIKAKRAALKQAALRDVNASAASGNWSMQLV